MLRGKICITEDLNRQADIINRVEWIAWHEIITKYAVTFIFCFLEGQLIAWESQIACEITPFRIS